MDINVRNNIKVLGKGTKPMIFAHGFGCGQNMWRYVWPEFEEDYKIVLFDYVGSGKSDISAYNEQRYSNLNGYAEDVLEICASLDLKDAVFVGHSVSSMIGLLASIKKPEYFSSLVMIGPSPRYIDDESYNGGFQQSDIEELLDTMEKNYMGWANFLAPAMMANADRPGLGQELTDSFCATNPQIARQFAEVTFLSDNRRDLLNASHPCLIMQCSNDIIAPTAVGQYLYNIINNSTHVLLNASGHCPHLSEPEETVAEIKKFLTNINVSL